MHTPALLECNTHGFYNPSFVDYDYVGRLTSGCVSWFYSTTVAEGLTIRGVKGDGMVILKPGSWSTSWVYVYKKGSHSKRALAGVLHVVKIQ